MCDRLGIVGFGVVGKSVARFFKTYSFDGIVVWDERDLSSAERAMAIELGVKEIFSKKDCTKEQFIEACDKVVLSPGICSLLSQKYAFKAMSELDLFSQTFEKRVVAVTGTLGKTTVTRLLGALIPGRTVVGGNIGEAMLDFVGNQAKIDSVVLELSSFQLEQNKSFAPDVGILTNLYPNHLDRHVTLKAYFDAKWLMFMYQSEKQQAIFPLSLFDGEVAPWFVESMARYRGIAIFVHDKLPSLDHLMLSVMQGRAIVFVYGEKILRGIVENGVIVNIRELCDLKVIPEQSFLQNWLVVVAILDLFGLTGVDVKERLQSGVLKLDNHRLELFAQINGIDFYNDSKSTVLEATRVAVDKLLQKNRPVILIVGGLSKGVNRRPLVDYLLKVNDGFDRGSRVKKIFCLGEGCEAFAHYERHASLSSLVHAIMQVAVSGDQVLFSPSGSSFDLFLNYIHRGEEFKKTVLQVAAEPD